MIYGIGHDIVENKRMKELLDKYSFKLAVKLLSQAELILFKVNIRPEKFLAKRFAAKEAFAKACGTGLKSPITFNNISIINDDLGKPLFQFEEPLLKWLNARNITDYHISISDEASISSAFVILETN